MAADYFCFSLIKKNNNDHLRHKRGREAASFIKIPPFKIQQRGSQAAIMCTSAAHLSTVTATHLPPFRSFSLSLSLFLAHAHARLALHHRFPSHVRRRSREQAIVHSGLSASPGNAP